MSSTHAKRQLRAFLSAETYERLASRINDAAAPLEIEPVFSGSGCSPECVDADFAFISRDITGLSTKHEIAPSLQHFYDGLLGSRNLRWVHIHSAGIDRPVVAELARQGVTVTASAGANAEVVAQTALAGILTLARDMTRLREAQQLKRWTPLLKSGLPRDLSGQTAVIVGWGHIGQRLGAILQFLGLKIAVVRSSAEAVENALTTVPFERLNEIAPQADWLILACPLSVRTRHLVDSQTFALMKKSARIVNVSRGEVVAEADLIAALRIETIAGAYLDVFEREPLDAMSPLWDLPNVLVTPHTAGHSDGNEARVDELFLSRLRQFCSERLVALV